MSLWVFKNLGLQKWKVVQRISMGRIRIWHSWVERKASQMMTSECSRSHDEVRRLPLVGALLARWSGISLEWDSSSWREGLLPGRRSPLLGPLPPPKPLPPPPLPPPNALPPSLDLSSPSPWCCPPLDPKQILHRKWVYRFRMRFCEMMHKLFERKILVNC